MDNTIAKPDFDEIMVHHQGGWNYSNNDLDFMGFIGLINMLLLAGLLVSLIRYFWLRATRR